jgi:hypothetical protein
MDSVWGSVLFTNALSVGPTMGLGLALGEVRWVGSIEPVLGSSDDARSIDPRGVSITSV